MQGKVVPIQNSGLSVTVTDWLIAALSCMQLPVSLITSRFSLLSYRRNPRSRRGTGVSRTFSKELNNSVAKFLKSNITREIQHSKTQGLGTVTAV